MTHLTTAGASLRGASACADLLAGLARRTGTDAADWSLVFKARYGMEVAFRAIRRALGPGSVATTPFTCCTALDPILVAGLGLAWCDISDANLAIEPAEIRACAGDVRAVVVQHTFGIVDEAASVAVADAAHALGAVVVEDSAHCAGRMARGVGGEPVADVSIHSFGTEKMVRGSYHGGAVWVNPRMACDDLARPLRSALAGLPGLDGRLARQARGYPAAIRVLNHLPSSASRALRGALVSLGLFEPAIVDVERSGGLPYGPQRLDERLAARSLAGMAALDALESRSVAGVAAYNEALAATPALSVPAAVLGDAQPLLRYPLRVPAGASADAAVAAANAAGFYTVPWYRPLLFPGPLDAAAYGWDPDDGRCPRARAASAEIVALPCDIEPADAPRALGAVTSAL